MSSGWLCRLKTISVIPCRRRFSTVYSSTGRFTIGTIGLGIVCVRGRSRVPAPAAITIARTVIVLPPLWGKVSDGGTHFRLYPPHLHPPPPAGRKLFAPTPEAYRSWRRCPIPRRSGSGARFQKACGGHRD